MKLQVTFRNFDHTEALDSLIQKKTQKLKKYLGANTKVVWNCYLDKRDQVSEVNISGFSGPDISATAKTETLYKSIDQVILKLEKQLSKKQRDLNMRVSKKQNRNFTESEMEAS